MTKKIAVINDLSGFGRCSLTAAISVLSAMGVQACPLPTAILTAQTEYPSYYCDDYTDKMEYYRREWEKMGEAFDGIYTGFMASEEQIRQTFRFLDTFCRPGTFLLVDPVMGDDGETYKTFTSGLLALMKELAARSDILTPNLTELCLLSDEDYGALLGAREDPLFLQKIGSLARKLCGKGPAHVVVTGIPLRGEDGAEQMGNLHVYRTPAQGPPGGADESTGGWTYDLSSFPKVGGSYSGTGDLFASCLAAGYARGERLSDTIRMTGRFLEAALADSVREGVPELDGVNYEKYLHLLWRDV